MDLEGGELDSALDKALKTVQSDAQKQRLLKLLLEHSY